MKPRLSPALQQHLVLTPQLRQAIRLLQLSTAELEAELAAAVESNPLLDWVEPGAAETGGTPDGSPGAEAAPADDDGADPGPPEAADWEAGAEPWQERIGPASPDDDDAFDPGERAAEGETLRAHLLWQLQMGHFDPREAAIGEALIDAIDEDGYLRDELAAIAVLLAPQWRVDEDDVRRVLYRIQQFDPVGVGARDLGECLRLQLQALPADTPGRTLALAATEGALERLPRLGVEGLARSLGCSADAADAALQLLRSLDPRPGARYASLPPGTYVSPDCVVWRQHGQWRVALAADALPRVGIQHDYARMLRHARSGDADYLRQHLQEARWLIKGLQARADTLLRVVRHLVREQAAFLEFGPQALRPLTLRRVAEALEMHESTVSRAIARKYVRTPRGTLPLRDFFASGIDTGDGGSASSTAIQDMIRRLIAAEDPRKPLSDARLADTLKAQGVPVARRTVAKYREEMQIPASHERVRIG